MIYNVFFADFSEIILTSIARGLSPGENKSADF